jgi:hypothetical protein
MAVWAAHQSRAMVKFALMNFLQEAIPGPVSVKKSLKK